MYISRIKIIFETTVLLFNNQIITLINKQISMGELDLPEF